MTDDGSDSQRDLITIKIPKATDADPDDIGPDYEFDPDDYDPDAIHGFYMHRERKDSLSLEWLEYINSQALPEHVAEMLSFHAEHKDGMDMSWLEYLDYVFKSGGDVDSDAIADAVVDRLESELSGDVREAAYTGAREAVQEGGQGTF